MAATTQPPGNNLPTQVDLLISLHLWSWPALTLAIQNAWGGSPQVSRDKRDWLAGAISELLTSEPPQLHDMSDLEEVLLQVMVDEFEVVVDDGSAEETAAKIWKGVGRLRTGDASELQELYRRWVDKQEKDVDEDVDMGEAPPLLKQKIEPEIDEDGFTKVVACRHDVPRLAHIESSAGQLFRTVGLDTVADDDPMPAEVLLSYLEVGNLWVAEAEAEASVARTEGEGKADANESVIGFLAAFPIVKHKRRGEAGNNENDDNDAGGTFLHIAELSVHADHQRRGVAKRLLSTLDEAAQKRKKEDPKKKGQGVVGLSLTTYRDLPFNGPLYAKFGFQEIGVEEIEGLVGLRGRELWEEEQEKMRVKAAWPERRCWMVKTV
ncbi:hypothetical protein DV736_g5779, partial [Chaetothyriales sp. CBS 134916]